MRQFRKVAGTDSAVCSSSSSRDQRPERAHGVGKKAARRQSAKEARANRSRMSAWEKKGGEKKAKKLYCIHNTHA